jgi:hypothetical protein
MDGQAVSVFAATPVAPDGLDAGLAEFLGRPQAPVSRRVTEAIAAGPMDPALAADRHDLDRLLDPEPLAAETGWCTLDDGCGYVAVRTEMPGISPEMVDWWFDWHPHDALRYRVWCPLNHEGTGFEPGSDMARSTPGAKPFWGTVHYPVEDIGMGMQHIRIAFHRPSLLGFSGDVLDDPRVGTVVAGLSGDPRLHLQHSLMAHVFLNAPGGLVLRSHFWAGSALRPDLPDALAAAAAWLLNRPAVRRRAIPSRAPAGLADHCSREYAHLASILPELYERFGPGSTNEHTTNGGPDR